MQRYSAGTEAKAIDSFGVWHHCTIQSVHEEGLMVVLASGTRKQQEIHSNRHWKLNSHTNRVSK